VAAQDGSPGASQRLSLDEKNSPRRAVCSNVGFQVSLVKSKLRVADHGEVFTPAWMVEAMLDLVKDETERID